MDGLLALAEGGGYCVYGDSEVFRNKVSSRRRGVVDTLLPTLLVHPCRGLRA
jgi:hypothetical protein